MTTTRRLSKAYDARIERLTALMRLRAEWERRTIRTRVQASL
jgi:hypothetical protein